MTRIVRKIFYAMFSFVLSFLVVMAGIFPAVLPASAEQTSKSVYEQTNVLDDLTNATIDGKPFSLTEYNFDERKETQLLVLSEYCYSFYKDKQESYGLYAYVYNPKGLLYEENSEVNRIQMSVGEGNGYTKYALTY